MVTEGFSSSLLPANEVWGKVMFYTPVFLFTMGVYDVTSCLTVWSHVLSWGCMMSLPVWLSGPMFFLGGVWCHFLSGLMFLRGGGLCQEGLSVRGGSTSREMPQYWYLVLATKAGGTHPTGLHSCSTMYCKYLPHIWMVMKGLFWPLYGNWCWNWCGSQIFQNSLPRITMDKTFLSDQQCLYFPHWIKHPFWL